MIHSREVYSFVFSLKPGRDTDAVIAERVLGYHREIVPKDGSGEHGGNEYLVPPNLSKDYQLPPKGPILFAFHAPLVSTDESYGFRGAMWLWRDILSSLGWQCSLVHKPFEKNPDDQWVFHGTRLVDNRKGEIWSFSAHAETVAMAICRGALLSLTPDKWKWLM